VAAKNLTLDNTIPIHIYLFVTYHGVKWDHEMQPVLWKPPPWNPADATDNIRALARGVFNISRRNHSKAQLLDRSLNSGDMLYVLKNGFVYEEARFSDEHQSWSYRMECLTPNSPSREVAVAVVPAVSPAELAIVTVMWVDE
jgi:hypothetical protein